MVTIKEISTKKELKQFVDFPTKLYKDAQNFVPTLRSDELMNLDPKRNPAFEYCEAKYFLALRDGKIVGRIAAILSKKANAKDNVKRLRISRIDFIDDYEVSHALFNAAETWARELGMTEIIGPIGFCDLDKEGMLVDGFDEMSMFITIYNYPYYISHMEAYGFRKEIDWLEFRIKADSGQMERIERISERVLKRYNVSIVDIKSKRQVKPYIYKIFDLINQEYVKLYGAVEVTPRQIDMYVSQFLSLVNFDYLCLIEDSEKNLVGFGLAIPSLSSAVKKINGRMFPFGWITILKAIHGKKNDTLDLYLIAVTEKYQNAGFPALMLSHITKKALKNGIQFAETGPQLETNTAMHSVFNHFDRQQHKRRRCFIKSVE